jgi:predicted nucleotidyltransferase
MSQIFPTLKLPQPEIQYLHSLTDILQAELNVQLKAVYLFGSASYGAYEPGRSDLDLAVIIDSSLANVVCTSSTQSALD